MCIHRFTACWVLLVTDVNTNYLVVAVNHRLAMHFFIADCCIKLKNTFWYALFVADSLYKVEKTLFDLHIHCVPKKHVTTFLMIS